MFFDELRVVWQDQVQTYAELDEMLADPARKRPAWERLRPLVGKLGG